MPLLEQARELSGELYLERTVTSDALLLVLLREEADLRRSLEALGLEPQGLLVDGRDEIWTSIPCKAVVDGDALSQAVAAASIVAKVTRDALMNEDDARFPLYGFSQHKGYGTPEHLEALRLHGPCLIHRKSFRPVRELLFVQEAFEGF